MFSSLNKPLNKPLFRRIGFRLSVGFLILFVLSSFASFGLLYLLLRQSLREKDHEILESRIRQYSLVYENEGVPGLRNAFARVHSQIEGHTLLVRLKSPNGDILFSHEPVIRDSDTLETISERLPSGELLEVGKDTDDRDDVLERARDAFLLLTLPCLLIGVLSALYFTSKTLLPVRELVTTMKAIQSGNVAARVKRTGSGDELDELSVIFNQMVDRIEHLIQGMRESLDFVAHDLRTPMTRMRGLAERAIQSNNPSETLDALSETIESTDYILSLLNAIMDITEAESGAMRLRLGPIHVRQLFEECVDLYSLIADERDIKLSIGDSDVTVMADPRIRQAIANLLDNALKYSHSGTSVLLRAFRDKDQIVITVEDQGYGISTQDLPRIWDRLYRADQSRSTRGMGIGLSLVRSIVKAHGGNVSVQSELGKGSNFQIFLPQSVEVAKPSV